ncbi:S18L2 protein, partial [Polyodon spathula]|nr:S18L2 protein [Polyodon spathula]
MQRPLVSRCATIAVAGASEAVEEWGFVGGGAALGDVECSEPHVVLSVEDSVEDAEEESSQTLNTGGIRTEVYSRTIPSFVNFERLVIEALTGVTGKFSPRLLEENDQLVRVIVEYQRKGRATECVRLQLKTLAFVLQHKYKGKRARILVHQRGKKTQTHGEANKEECFCVAAKLEEIPVEGAQSLAVDHTGDCSICMDSFHWLTGLVIWYKEEL